MQRWIISLCALFLVLGAIHVLYSVIRLNNNSSPVTTVIPSPAFFPSDKSEYVVMAAGDIACDNLPKTVTQCQQDATANLILQNNPDAVLALGDQQYPAGTLQLFNQYYDKSWGQFKDKTYPVIGNHEYSDLQVGYFDYFGQKAGTKNEGFYSFDLGDWHLIALNSNCWAVPCRKDSVQYTWLQNDLDSTQKKCVLAFWHHPLFSSGEHGRNPEVKSFWDLLSSHQAELVLNGHDHIYERFSPQNPEGVKDENGITQIIAGTGGRNLYTYNKLEPNSEFKENTQFGVLKLILKNDSYDFSYVTTQNQVLDSGTGRCH
jgi:hypothetical protein